MNTEKILEKMNDRLFSKEYIEDIQRIYDEQVACGMFSEEEADFKKGIAYFRDHLHDEQKMFLLRIHASFQVMSEYAAEYCFFCGLLYSFVQCYGIAGRTDHDFMSIVHELDSRSSGSRHNLFRKEKSNWIQLDEKLLSQFDDEAENYLDGIDAYYEQRIYSSALNGYYIGFLAGAAILIKIDPSVKMKMLARILLLELNFGFRGCGMSFLDIDTFPD
jgi:hypothetical protein